MKELTHCPFLFILMLKRREVCWQIIKCLIYLRGKEHQWKCYVSSCLQCNPYFLFLYMKSSGFIAIIIYKFTMGEDQNQQNHEENGVKEAPHVAVVMVPFPAQGHLNQLLQLSRIISSYNIPVHYVGSATHINQAKLRLQGWDPLLEPNFHFHDFPTPHFHSPPPDPDASVQFPAHLQPCFEASSELREPVAALLRELSLTVDRLIVINDSLMGSVVQDFVGIGNAESYTFHSVSVFSIFFFFWESLGRPALEGVKIPEDVPSLDGCFTLEFFKFLVFQHEFKKLSSGNLYYTSKLIEGPYVDILREEEIDGIQNWETNRWHVINCFVIQEKIPLKIVSSLSPREVCFFVYKSWARGRSNLIVIQQPQASASLGMDNHQNHEESEMKEAPVAVVMVPFPAQGHLNQLLQLSRLISSYNVSVHYVGSVTHTHQAKLRVQGWDPLLHPNFQFHHFPTPHFHSPPPNPNSSVQFPAHLESSFEASSQLRQPVAALLRELSPRARRIIVIHDSLMGSVIQDVASIRNAESYTFHSAKFLEDVPSLDGCFPLEFLNFIASQHQFKKLNSGNIYNTCKSMEGCYVDLLDGLEIYGGKKKHWALGPFNPLTICYDKKSNPGHRCLGWLDKQAPKSVLLVSFGTTTSLTDEQIKELAIGLEQSKQKFIWVLRDADKGDVFSGEVRRAELPEGYEERVGGRGMGLVVRDWAPQLEILGHTQVLKVGLVVRDWAQREQLVAASTGGFPARSWILSLLTSLDRLVCPGGLRVCPCIRMSSKFITHSFSFFGLVFREWEHQEELVTSSTIEKALRRLMASKEGNDIRKRAVELGGAIWRSMDDRGASCMELDSFIAHISR
ncbi:unnamed protein product, partial [Vitis vinifera]